MIMFWIFAAVAVLGLIGYGFQIWAVRSTLKTGKGINTGKGKGTGKANTGTAFLSQPIPLPLLLSSALPLPQPLPLFLPAVSILKPLKGLDDNLFDNLESFCMLDYPEYEIIFSLQDHNDLAYKVAKKIKDKYPDKDITVLVERCNDGLNPKVNNLIPAYAASKYELVLVSDSNVMVGQDYLKEIARHMEDPDVGLVSNLIKGTGGSSIGSVFENLHLNSFIVGSVCFLDRFMKMPCVIGKSCS